MKQEYQCRLAGIMQAGKAQRTESHLLTTLPQPLLDLILITYTSKQDKKALRQTCRQFREALDANVVSISLQLRNHENRNSLMMLKKFFARLSLARCLILHDTSHSGITKQLLKHLPDSVTTLTLLRGFTNLRELRRLRSLTSLTLGIKAMVSGLNFITGLTRLECRGPVGSVAHLAPTLKHLCFWEYEHVDGLDRLTNLEALELHGFVYTSSIVFQKIAKLPIKYLYMPLPWCDKFFPELCTTVSPTLTSLVLNGEFNEVLEHEFVPTRASQLQLLQERHNTFPDRQPLATAPMLNHLDLHLHFFHKDKIEFALRGVCQLTTLSSLSLYISDSIFSWDYRNMVTAAPEIARMPASNVRVRIVEDIFEVHNVFRSRRWMETAWATVA